MISGHITSDPWYFRTQELIHLSMWIGISVRSSCVRKYQSTSRDSRKKEKVPPTEKTLIRNGNSFSVRKPMN